MNKISALGDVQAFYISLCDRNPGGSRIVEPPPDPPIRTLRANSRVLEAHALSMTEDGIILVAASEGRNVEPAGGIFCRVAARPVAEPVAMSADERVHQKTRLSPY